MKLGVSKLLAAGLLAAAVPVLGGCYATVGADGRTYFQPLTYTGNYGYNRSLGYGYSSMNRYAGYSAAPQYTSYSVPQATTGYSYYSTTAPAYSTYNVSTPATTSYTTYPVVNRRYVSSGSSSACIVASRPSVRMSCN